jgi:hypothetical protein
MKARLPGQAAAKRGTGSDADSFTSSSFEGERFGKCSLKILGMELKSIFGMGVGADVTQTEMNFAACRAG